MYPPFSKTLIIHAAPAVVWAAIIQPVEMKEWMTEKDIDIISDFTVGNPFTIKGETYGMTFENYGTVLAFEPNKHFSYSHLSSISKLPDEPASYTILNFVLEEDGAATRLTFIASDFPTESIYRHMAFYWNVALEMLKKKVEKN